MIESDVQKLSPGSLVEFWEINASAMGGDIARFHAQDDYPVWWQGLEYSPWPVEGEGFARTSDQQPTPKLRVGNLDGSISRLCLAFDDLVGATITRRRTFTKYLDNKNFGKRNLLSFSTVMLPGTNGWGTNGAGHTLTYNVPSHDGSPTATRVEVANSGGGVYAWNNNHAPIVAGTKIVASAWIRSTVLTRIRFGVDGNTAQCAIGPEWKRVVVATEPTVDLAGAIICYPYNDDSATPSFEIADVQLEYGAAATEFQKKVNGEGVNPTVDPTQEFPPEVWFIERKSAETREAVEFELSSALDFMGVRLPRRQIIANQCPFDYRGALCNYTGPPVADILDAPTSDPAQDRCGKRLASCKLRQWPDDVLNFGGFPAAGLVRT